MRPVALAVVLLLLVSVAFAQSAKNGDSPPIPKVLKNAYTVFLINAGDPPLLQQAYSELKKWGRFKVVGDAEEADLVLILETVETGSVTLGSDQTTTTSSTTGGYEGRGSWSTWSTPGTTTSTTTRRPARQITTGFTRMSIFDAVRGDKAPPIMTISRNWNGHSGKDCIKELRIRMGDQ